MSRSSPYPISSRNHLFARPSRAYLQHVLLLGGQQHIIILILNPTAEEDSSFRTPPCSRTYAPRSVRSRLEISSLPSSGPWQATRAHVLTSE